jgi:hypothetical protein
LLSQHFGDKGWFQERHREQRSVAIDDDGEGILLQPAKKTIIDLPRAISALGLFENSYSQPAHWLASGSRSTLVPSSGFGSIVLNEWRTCYAAIHNGRGDSRHEHVERSSVLSTRIQNVRQVGHSALA